MRMNKMRDITIKLIDEGGNTVNSESLRVSKEDFEKRFHEKFYDIIRTYAGRAEDHLHLNPNYQIVMDVRRI